jgi:acyl-CoA thioester hydrolase
MAPFSRIQATAADVSSPPENAMPTRSATGNDVRTVLMAGHRSEDGSADRRTGRAPVGSPAVTYRHVVRIRYGECDMQKVVFNANYLAYIDDATDTWFRAALGPFEATGFDFMVKKVAIEWQSAARFGEVLDLDLEVTRWGTSSFDVGVVGTAGERPVLTASLVYVSTIPGQATARPVPADVRAALSGTGQGT